ncbi:inorganic phosphate transporter [Rhodopila globiformis]|nr:inorganic phosphate transporter [Rhodopila globiformis]
MVRWKRIVVMVGERIGKTHLTYAQGASAETVAMATTGLADAYGLPVSTTHVLSSGVAGTMAANGSGLQWSTIRNMALARVMTLPAAMTDAWPTGRSRHPAGNQSSGRRARRSSGTSGGAPGAGCRRHAA